MFPAISYRSWLLQRPKEKIHIARRSTSTPISRHASTHDIKRSMSLPAEITNSSSLCRLFNGASNDVMETVGISHEMEDLRSSLNAEQLRVPSKEQEDTLGDPGIGVSRSSDIVAMPRRNRDSDICAVCIASINEEDNIRALECSHIFHVACIDTWLENRRACCPLCMKDLRSFRSEEV